MKKTLMVYIFLALSVISIASFVSAANYSTLQEYQDSIDYTCQTDSDCVVKNVGTCCGYFPKCTNNNAIVDPDFVRNACETERISSDCSFSEPESCSCVNNRCISSDQINTCGNNICEEGEANDPGGCGPNADPRCLGPPARQGTCPQDCPNDCQNLFWFDEENKECSQKEFCGFYMYSGLQTFQTESQCLNELNKNNCEQDSDCKLIYGPCSCSAVPITDERNELDEGNIQCIWQECYGMNVTALCFNNKCVRSDKGKVFHLSNGRNAEIKILPETASQTAIDRLGELGFTIKLKEVGTGNNAKAAYELSAKKEAKIFGFIKKQADVKVYVDAETGDVISVKRPWWSFLATKI